MKIFLAGASGVIGRSLVPQLTGAGHDVTGMTGDAAATGHVRSLGARPVVVDVFDRDRLAEVIRSAHPERRHRPADQPSQRRLPGNQPPAHRGHLQPRRRGPISWGPDCGGAKLLYLRTGTRAGR